MFILAGLLPSPPKDDSLLVLRDALVLLLPAVKQRSLPPNLLPAVEALARMRHRILLLYSEQGNKKATDRRSTRQHAKGDGEKEEDDAGMPPSWIIIMAACCIEVRGAFLAHARMQSSLVFPAYMSLLPSCLTITRLPTCF